MEVQKHQALSQSQAQLEQLKAQLEMQKMQQEIHRKLQHYYTIFEQVKRKRLHNRVLLI